MTKPRSRDAWTKLAEETVIKIAEREAAKRKHWSRDYVKIYGYVGDANVNEVPMAGDGSPVGALCGEHAARPPIPTLTDAIAGPGAKRKPRSKSKRAAIPYHQQLSELLRQYYAIPAPRPEYQFDKTRRWRWDFAWPEEKIALEIDGGLWINGGHNRGAALLKQMEKQNAGTLQGWRILRYTPTQIDQAAADVARLLLEKKP